MSTLRIDLTKQVKKIKPMHAGGQPPLAGRYLTDMFHYLTEAGIPYSRLHDVGGVYAANRFVDIPNIFRDFDADETDPKNYDFTFTDHLITALVEAGCEPYFRLGVTIENHVRIKPYRVFPPEDCQKWARICEHIIRHYTEGWADGFKYNITYWEIWNEPEIVSSDNYQNMWIGTAQQFYELYAVTAKHLKECFAHIKIGGYGSCGFYQIAPRPGMVLSEREKYYITFMQDFFEYIKKENAPIDFFSWHTYSNTECAIIMDKWLHSELERLGYAGLETHLNEWNPYAKEFGTAHHSAEVAATMLAMQNGYTDICCIYDMRANTAPFCPLFDVRNHKPIHAYYALAAFNALYKLGTQVYTECDTECLYAVCASDGKNHALMLSNLTGEDITFDIEGADIKNARFHVIDNERLLSWSPVTNTIENNAVLLIEW